MESNDRAWAVSWYLLCMWSGKARYRFDQCQSCNLSNYVMGYIKRMVSNRKNLIRICMTGWSIQISSLIYIASLPVSWFEIVVIFDALSLINFYAFLPVWVPSCMYYVHSAIVPWEVNKNKRTLLYIYVFNWMRGVLFTQKVLRARRLNFTALRWGLYWSNYVT